jgi:hypothetical protein
LYSDDSFNTSCGNPALRNSGEGSGLTLAEAHESASGRAVAVSQKNIRPI